MAKTQYSINNRKVLLRARTMFWLCSEVLCNFLVSPKPSVYELKESSKAWPVNKNASFFVLNIFPVSVCLEFIISFFFFLFTVRPCLSHTDSFSHLFFLLVLFVAFFIAVPVACVSRNQSLVIWVVGDRGQRTAGSECPPSSCPHPPSYLSRSLSLLHSCLSAPHLPSTITPFQPPVFPFLLMPFLSLAHSLFNVLQMLFLALFSFSGTFSHPLPFIHSVPKRWIPPGARHWAT